MEDRDDYEALGALIRRVKLRLIDAEMAPSASARRRHLRDICSELKELLASEAEEEGELPST